MVPKLKLEQTVEDKMWVAARKVHQKVQLAMSHKPRLDSCPPSVVYFENHPFEGIVRTEVREIDDKIRMVLIRKGHLRVCSKWHDTKEEALACIRAKCPSMLQEKIPAISHKRSVEADVKFIHQVYGLYRDGKEMLSIYKLSSSAWQAYAKRHGCEYKLWTADEVDTLIQREAPGSVQTLYRDVRFPVQRIDVCRFFIIFKYGGLYADLDVFPNFESFHWSLWGCAKC